MNINCPNCGAKLDIPVRLYGKRGKCPKCGNIIPIPDEDTPFLTVSEEPVFKDMVGQVKKTDRQPVDNKENSRSQRATSKESMIRTWLWIFGIIAVFAIIAKLFIWPDFSSNKENNKEPDKQEDGWVVVAELSGTGKNKSDLFELTSEKCRLTYSVEGGVSDDPMFKGRVFFAVFVIKEGTTKDDRVVPEVYAPYAGSDIVYFEKEPGNYFLDIRAMTINKWEVKIEEYRSSRPIKMNEKKDQVKVSRCIGEMAYIPPGEFIMGCSSVDNECETIDKPSHRVKITKGFKIDKCEVTQGEYQRVTGSNPSKFINCGSACPVENVSWDDANSYCRKVGERLPTEAEWEYAARGGTTTKYYWGTSTNSDYAWYEANSQVNYGGGFYGKGTHPVGQKKPNVYGLYDISGNVGEWVNDWFGKNYYRNSPDADPTGPNSGAYRVSRCGAWFSEAWAMRVSDRCDSRPSQTSDGVGFRCANDMK